MRSRRLSRLRSFSSASFCRAGAIADTYTHSDADAQSDANGDQFNGVIGRGAD